MSAQVTPAELHVFRCMSDNAGALLRDPATGAVAAIDVPDSDEVKAELDRKGWKLTDILITHEHGDHIQGVRELKELTGARVSGPTLAAAAGLDRVLKDGDRFSVGAIEFAAWETPGHCPGHLCLVSPAEKLAFVGDVLFVMGCGRVLGGCTPDQLWAAISRLAALPDETTLVTGHDYTLSNARFALSVDPANLVLKARLAEAEQAKEQNRFWAVTTLGEERATNPFMRAAEPALAAAVGRVGAAPAAVFAALREAKNRF